MKLYIIILTSLLILKANSCTAQETNDWNLSFEEWDESRLNPDILDTIVENREGIFPENWYTDSRFLIQGRGIGRTTDAFHGEFALVLSGWYGDQRMQISMGESSNNLGSPIDIRPQSLSGVYKSILLDTVTIDSLIGKVEVYLTKWDNFLDSRDTIGIGILRLSEINQYYQPFEIPIIYNNSIPPDSISIVLSKHRFGFASETSCFECGHVFFDNLKLDILSAVSDDPRSSLRVNFFPNPTFGELNIVNPLNKDLELSLFSLTGEHLEILQLQPNSKISKSLNHLPSGVYILSDLKMNAFKKIVKK